MFEFICDIAVVMTALWLYNRVKDWKERRRYHG